MSTRSLDRSDTERALPWPALVDALRAMLLRRHAKLTHAPERIAMPLPGGVLLAMPSTDGEFACTKLATLHDGNIARGLPTLIGEAILIRADTGEALARFDAATITARRTAAMSALAALELAGPRRERLLVCGSGVQARAHIEAFRAVMPLREVSVHSRNPANAEALAREIRDSGLECRALTPPPASGARVAAQAAPLDPAQPDLSQFDLVVTATPSREPLFADDPRFDGFIAAIGAYRPEMCELPASLLHRATLFCDDFDAARSEAGDLIRAGIDWTNVVPLEHVVADDAKRATRGPVVFKSVGHALWDLAACRLAFTQLQPETVR